MTHKLFVIANLGGIALYLSLASTTRTQENTPLLFRSMEDAMAWLELCVPVLVFFTLVDICWLMRIQWERNRIFPTLGVWSLAVLCWICAFNFDMYRFKYEIHPLGADVLEGLRHGADDATRQANEAMRRKEAGAQK